MLAVLRTALLQVIRDVLQDEDQGLALGLAHAQDLGIEGLKIGGDVVQGGQRLVREKGLPRRQAQILSPRQIFGLEEGIQHADQAVDQAVGVLFVEFALFQLEFGQENGQERAQTGVLTEKRVHLALRLPLPQMIILASFAKVNLKLLFLERFAILFAYHHG